MNNFNFVTVDQLIKAHPDEAKNRERLEVIASTPDSNCKNCGNEKAWRLAETGMCFTCTTGEADASDDYEII